MQDVNLGVLPETQAAAGEHVNRAQKNARGISAPASGSAVLVPGVSMPRVALWPELNPAVRGTLRRYGKMEPDVIQNIRDSRIGKIKVTDRLGQIRGLVWR
jgi:hypothetical protein